ncbi:MAG: manganese efflux pump, partial [Candidatus Omnitrophica bacterium]|nr:manganese efflux pump [Candidatus Omnitrophota bacterium]
MNIVSIIFIAFGLAMDAFAVSIFSGLTIKNLKIKHAFKIALFFGLFQAFMPIIGWLSGVSLKNYISGIDHWIAFTILFVIGIKMIYESFKIKPDDKKINPLAVYTLL